jgi:hypothetical protein
MSAHTFLMIAFITLAGCGERQGKTTTEVSEGKIMTKDQILEIARQDAATKYRDLTIYDVTATQVGTEWHVVYALKDDRDGGGPEYTIDQGGKIVSKKYYQ